MSYRIEYWTDKGWQTSDEHRSLTPSEYAAMQPHMKAWTSPWRVLSNSTGNIILKSSCQPVETKETGTH
jgi:hypothetical protein